jgi:uncharacterized protein YdeI (YjbR/CyaY-like superfamily)
MMQNTEPETFCPAGREEWRQWLAENHRAKPSVWLVYYKKEAGMPTISYSDAVDESLCFGWIDSTKRSLGNDRYEQLFTKRKPNSAWSKINKAKIERLIAEGLMTEAGYECIEAAKKNGSWALLDEVEELVIPKDLEKAFKTHKGSKDFFMGLSKSAKKMILYWLVQAKQPETRQRRITEIAELAAQGLKPKQFR